MQQHPHQFAMLPDSPSPDPVGKIKTWEKLAIIEDAACDRRLSPIDLHALVILIKHRNRSTGEIFPSLDRLAFYLHRSPRTVASAVKRLERRGYITVLISPGSRVNHYQIVFDPGERDRLRKTRLATSRRPSKKNTQGLMRGPGQYASDVPGGNQRAGQAPVPESFSDGAVETLSDEISNGFETVGDGFQETVSLPLPNGSNTEIFRNEITEKSCSDHGRFFPNNPGITRQRLTRSALASAPSTSSSVLNPASAGAGRFASAPNEAASDSSRFPTLESIPAPSATASRAERWQYLRAIERGLAAGWPQSRDGGNPVCFTLFELSDKVKSDDRAMARFAEGLSSRICDRSNEPGT